MLSYTPVYWKWKKKTFLKPKKGKLENRNFSLFAPLFSGNLFSFFKKFLREWLPGVVCEMK